MSQTLLTTSRCWIRMYAVFVLCGGLFIGACSQGGFRALKPAGVLRFGDIGPRVWAGQDQIVGTNELVTFSADQSNDPKRTFSRFVWDLGDGTTLEGGSVQHAYAQAGEYPVTLKVTNALGEIISDSVRIQVMARGLPAILEMVPQKAFVRPGERIFFDVRIRNMASIPQEIVDGQAIPGIAILNDLGLPDQFLANGTEPQCERIHSSIEIMVYNYIAGQEYVDIADRVAKQGGPAPLSFPSPLFRHAWVSLNDKMPSGEPLVRCSMTVSRSAVQRRFTMPCQLVEVEDHSTPVACQGFRLEVVR